MSLDTPVFAAPPRTVTVEVWSDVACPWCFIGKRRFATALRDFPHAEHVEVVWRSYQLSPDTPTGPGRPEVDALVEMKGLPRDQVQQMFGHVTDVAAGEGLRYDFDRTLAFNTFDAHRLLHLARRAGGAALVEATMRVQRHYVLHVREVAATGLGDRRRSPWARHRRAASGPSRVWWEH